MCLMCRRKSEGKSIRSSNTGLQFRVLMGKGIETHSTHPQYPKSYNTKDFNLIIADLRTESQTLGLTDAWTDGQMNGQNI